MTIGNARFVPTGPLQSIELDSAETLWLLGSVPLAPARLRP